MIDDLPGLHIICEPGTPSATYRCPDCGHLDRLQGRKAVAERVRDLRINHRIICPNQPAKDT
ncbi:hypothetical protein BX265_4993 [Streptomyces sp. TLI_235]|nr:hypothetical protein [Streptomyces sp. TLI_235]PBC80157.1 hypothetical protein BX265_4993 [Streptomyces sp. TLI_235]